MLTEHVFRHLRRRIMSLQAGDVMYVPDSWGHGILNLVRCGSFESHRRHAHVEFMRNLQETSAAYASTFYGPRHMFVHARGKEPH